MSKTVKVIAYYEDYWMPPGTDLNQWDDVCVSYGATLQMIRDWSEAVIPVGAYVVVFDPGNLSGINLNVASDITTALTGHDNVVFVFGRSDLNFQSLLPADSWDTTITITTPSTLSMFGVTAGSIILHSLNTG